LNWACAKESASALVSRLSLDAAMASASLQVHCGCSIRTAVPASPRSAASPLSRIPVSVSSHTCCVSTHAVLSQHPHAVLFHHYHASLCQHAHAVLFQHSRITVPASSRIVVTASSRIAILLLSRHYCPSILPHCLAHIVLRHSQRPPHLSFAPLLHSPSRITYPDSHPLPPPSCPLPPLPPSLQQSTFMSPCCALYRPAGCRVQWPQGLLRPHVRAQGRGPGHACLRQHQRGRDP